MKRAWQNLPQKDIMLWRVPHGAGRSSMFNTRIQMNYSNLIEIYTCENSR